VKKKRRKSNKRARGAKAETGGQRPGEGATGGLFFVVKILSFTKEGRTGNKKQESELRKSAKKVVRKKKSGRQKWLTGCPSIVEHKK